MKKEIRDSHGARARAREREREREEKRKKRERERRESGTIFGFDQAREREFK